MTSANNGIVDKLSGHSVDETVERLKSIIHGGTLVRLKRLESAMGGGPEAWQEPCSG